MNASTDMTYAERMGGALGRLWRTWRRLDESICSWLASYGVHVGLTKVVLWAIKLIVLGALFYIALWAALIFVIVAAAVVSSTRPVDLGEDWYKTEWHHGPAGYGLYDLHGYRIDPYDERDEQY